MARQAQSLARISRERILAELTRLLVGAFVDHGLDVLRRTGLLRVAIPGIEPLAAEAEDDHSGRFGREKDLWDHTVRVVRQAPPRPAVRWAALLHDAAKPLTRSVGLDGEVHFFGHERVGADLAGRVLSQLNADKALRTAVRALVALHGRPAAYEASWTDSAVRRLALEAGPVWDDLLDLAAADVTSGRERKRVEAARRVGALREHFQRLQDEADLARLESPLDGNELMRLFARPPGPWIKQVKDHLRELVIDGDLAPGDRERAAEIARELVAEMTADTADAGPPLRGAGASC
jgi:poly(A) polymerase